MYIRQITLTNWKAYKSITFEFPAPTDRQNIILIGARNGYGKTSLFQAILLGVFGKEGFDLITRSPLSSGSGQHSSYSKFLDSVVHKSTTDKITSCSVEITLVNDNETPVEIYRRWNFNSYDHHRPQDDYVRILESVDREPVGPSNQNEDRTEFYRDYIARVLLPPHLSSFFLFDGEKASIFADHDMAEQVKMGITGLLGIPIINTLAEDLRAYASDRRKDAPDVSDAKIDELEKSHKKFKERRAEKESRLGEAESMATKFKHERNNIQQEIANFGSGSQAETREQTDQMAKLNTDIQTQTAQLENWLADDIALALAGVGLRESLSTRLTSESIRNKWETGKQQGDSRLDSFIDALEKGIIEIGSNIDVAQREGILKIARVAWNKLWFPPPENCAKNYLHPYLNESDRGNVQQHLQRLGQVGAPSIINLIDSIDTDSSKLERLRAEMSHRESVAPHVNKKRERLRILNSKIEELDQEIGAVKREKYSLEGQISTQNEELGRLYATRNKAKPISRKIHRAMSIAKMIDEMVRSAVPSQIGAIANAMTIAYKDIAHKKELVDNIDIDDQCNVKLLDKNGGDVRNLDASAGEKQIFTQALISAVSEVSGRAFPTVIDTPLGRLDEQHRIGVLQHLAKSNRQVILLSTDTEVVGEYLHAIEPQIQKKYLVHHDVTTRTSTATIEYFYHG